MILGFLFHHYLNDTPLEKKNCKVTQIHILTILYLTWNALNDRTLMDQILIQRIPSGTVGDVMQPMFPYDAVNFKITFTPVPGSYGKSEPLRCQVCIPQCIWDKLGRCLDCLPNYHTLRNSYLPVVAVWSLWPSVSTKILEDNVNADISVVSNIPW